MAKNIEQKKTEKNSQLKLALLKYHKWLTLIVIIIIIGTSYYFILEPKYQQVGVGGSYNTKTLAEELEKRKDYLKQLEELNRNFTQVNQSQIAKLQKILPGEKDVAGLFVQLEALAEKNNFLLSGITITEAAEDATKSKEKINPSTIKKMNISLTLVGVQKSNTYGEVKGFLDDLENNLRLFDVNAVYFDSESTDYTVNLFTYYTE
ncbi:MAG: hypothetical protein HUU49_02800 [Candidatus Buchananbacteria bacterium]|nr:hypothetical protein [Candidatus Buchananbacteria bacterium]